MTLPQGPKQRWSLDFLSDAIFAVEPSQLLVVYDDAFAPEQDMQPPIAEPSANSGQFAQARPYRGIVQPDAAVRDRLLD
jgi:hypothetical protein